MSFDDVHAKRVDKDHSLRLHIFPTEVGKLV